MRARLGQSGGRRRWTHASAPAGGGKLEGGINATPLIDVVMCLIVFYLIVGRLAEVKLSVVDLPGAAAGAQDPEPDLLVINVALNEGDPAAPAVTTVEGRRFPDAALLEAEVRRRLQDLPSSVVVVRASRRLPWGQVEPVIAACREAGAPRVRLATEHEQVGAGSKGGAS